MGDSEDLKNKLAYILSEYIKCLLSYEMIFVCVFKIITFHHLRKQCRGTFSINWLFVCL